MHYCAVVCLSTTIIAHIDINEKYFHKIIREYFESVKCKQRFFEIFENINKISRGENVNG